MKKILSIKKLTDVCIRKFSLFLYNESESISFNDIVSSFATGYH